MGELLVQMEGIDKRFPGVHALDQCHFELRSGEVHALVGENGAGKSTLMKILGGIYSKDEGHVYLEGQEVEIVNTRPRYQHDPPGTEPDAAPDSGAEYFYRPRTARKVFVCGG